MFALEGYRAPRVCGARSVRERCEKRNKTQGAPLLVVLLRARATRGRQKARQINVVFFSPLY